MRALALMFVVCLVAMLPAAAFAQDGDEEPASNNPEKDGGFAVRVDDRYTIADGARWEVYTAYEGDVVVDGYVDDLLLVVRGDATIGPKGWVAKDIIVIDGNLTLRSGSRVKDVTLISSNLTREEGANVEGSIEERDTIFYPSTVFLFGFFAWLWLTIVALVGAVVFAAIGGRQLVATGTAMRQRPWPTLLGAVIVLIGIPLFALLAFITIIGIPVGMALVLFGLPFLFLIGVIVVGNWLGTFLVKRMRGAGSESHPYLEALIGVAILQVVLLIPFVGWIAYPLLALWGAGSALLVAFDAMRGRGTSEGGTPSGETPATPSAPPPAPAASV